MIPFLQQWRDGDAVWGGVERQHKGNKGMRVVNDGRDDEKGIGDGAISILRWVCKSNGAKMMKMVEVFDCFHTKFVI